MDGQENEQRGTGDVNARDRRERRWRPWRRTAGPADGSGRARRAGVVAAVLAVGLAGAVIGVLAGGRVNTDIGPFRAYLTLAPAVEGGTTVDIPPLGALQLDSHDGPTHLTVRLGALDQRRTEALIDDPASISRASQSAVEDVRNGDRKSVV